MAREIGRRKTRRCAEPTPLPPGDAMPSAGGVEPRRPLMGDHRLGHGRLNDGCRRSRGCREFTVAVKGVFRPHYVSWSEQQRIDAAARATCATTCASSHQGVQDVLADEAPDEAQGTPEAQSLGKQVGGRFGASRLMSREFWDSESGFGTVLRQFSPGKRGTRAGELQELQ